MDNENVVGYTQCSINSPIRRMKLCCLQKIDGTRDHHVKQNKPDSERQISRFLSTAESRSSKMP
jgi:hypothetical protein